MKQYKYTILKQDGTKAELPIGERKSLKDFYSLLNCKFVEAIPEAYYINRGYPECTMWGDEEGRYNENNKRNPFFDVLQGSPELGEPAEWDVVGDILMEQVL